MTTQKGSAPAYWVSASGSIATGTVAGKKRESVSQKSSHPEPAIWDVLQSVL
jgi:hypothetical protein